MIKIYTEGSSLVIERNNNKSFIPVFSLGFHSNTTGKVGITQNNVTIVEDDCSVFVDADSNPLGSDAESVISVMSSIFSTAINQSLNVGIDPAGRQRVGQLTTLLDGKELGVSDTLLWEKIGTGTQNFVDNKTEMIVTSGQFAIKASYLYMNYNSGKSLQVEFTFRKFAMQEGVIKRVGYFSSNAVSPFDADCGGR